MRKICSIPVSGFAVLLVLMVALPAQAHDDEQPAQVETTACLRGAISAGDYAELGQNIEEAIWDRRGGVSLASDVGGVRLRVLDANSQSVCQEEANTSTSCTFRLDITVSDEFTIIVDNAENEQSSHYRLCAF